VQSYYKLNVPHQKSASTTPSTRHHFYLEFLHSENGSNNGRTRYNRCPSFSSIRLVDLPPGSPPQSCSGEAPPQICRLFPHRSNWSRTSGVRTPEQGIKDSALIYTQLGAGSYNVYIGFLKPGNWLPGRGFSLNLPIQIQPGNDDTDGG
jgi:hypothetical protein